jgi:hypothetical protein
MYFRTITFSALRKWPIWRSAAPQLAGAIAGDLADHVEHAGVKQGGQLSLAVPGTGLGIY